MLKPGGRVAVSDIVSDEDSPESLKQDARLWSGCISGALREDEFCTALEAAGFHGIEIDKFEMEPWQIVEGIEYRSATYLAYKAAPKIAYEKNQAVIYKGPFRKISDDDGNSFTRGERVAVSDKCFNALKQEPYSELFYFIAPAVMVDEDIAFDQCCGGRRRDPQETKRGKNKITSDPSQRESCC